MDPRSSTEDQQEQGFVRKTCLAKVSGAAQAKTVATKTEGQMFGG